MDNGNMVVAKFVDGRILKGLTNDFFKSIPAFNVYCNETSKYQRVSIDNLKAVFFVKSFEGRKDQRRRLKHVPRPLIDGREARIHFNDGEVLEGFVQYYNPSEKVFLLVPDDPTGNNLRIFCVRKAVSRIVWLAEDKSKRPKKVKLADLL